MDEQLNEEFNRQINREFHSAYLYFAMSTYFSQTNFDGFAKYMKEQAQEELGHGKKIHNYLVHRNAKITLERIEAPNLTWVNAIDIFENSLNHEKFITENIHNLLKIACEKQDIAAKIFLQDFVIEQVEEEAKFTKILDAVTSANECACGMHMLDNSLK